MALLLLSGCAENKPVYDKVYNQNLLPLKCLNIDAINGEENKKLNNLFAPYSSKNCKYSLRLNIYKVAKCTAIESKTTGLGFSGYSRVEIYKNKDIIYKSQSDFVSDVNGSIERIANRIFKVGLLVKM